MLRSQLRGVKQRPDHFATRASDRTLAPADDRFHAAQQARCLTRPPETLANLLGSALRLSSRANGAVTLFGHWLAEPPMGSNLGLTPSSPFRTCSIAGGHGPVRAARGAEEYNFGE